MHNRPTSFSRLLEDIRTRMRSVCPMMPDVEFDELTLRMAEIDIKYRQREIFFSREAQVRYLTPPSSQEAQ
jgi:hypothetical protein